MALNNNTNATLTKIDEALLKVTALRDQIEDSILNQKTKSKARPKPLGEEIEEATKAVSTLSHEIARGDTSLKAQRHIVRQDIALAKRSTYDRFSTPNSGE